MSLIKRWMEEQEEQDVFINALKAVIENEEIDNEISLGISKKILDDESIDNLSDKQINVFNKYIDPHLTPECDSDECLGNGKIQMIDLPEAYNQKFELGGLYCEECVNYKIRLQNLMDEDD
ncbi:hypothetical protein SYK_05210 [Pseudodesulfovibrio nedwellii]|uniref:Uncharacterized protein n=1 Tax=Pseudodesulfovibrio nedwellii TaxID=2973072 RepID=A0ABM8AXF0_9BACT|nr:hypothetical protein [Pseudodesulfovibrio nedwellii]BDQ36161.1 hypothetical protein SYK_05210 [Pseudodesulfovibrio nedwellii]